VLVVDDTWVTGGSAQSAALTLKAAGASAVTILCAARWLSYTWSAEQRAVVESEVIPYDAMSCPVTGGACPS
jgi:orotate phosphoribosyltransferase